MNFETISVADLSLDPSNVRKHSRRNLDAIKASLRKFGQQKPIVVDAKGIVLAGNGTLTAAKELGWTEIQIVRTELEGVEATAFAIADNRTAELAEWEEDKLAQVLQSLKVEDADLLAATGYDAAEVDKMSKAEVTDDEVPEPPAEPITKPGDLWILGEHRVLCGDSTNAQDVERLMDGEKADMVFTDPPYGVKYDGGHATEKRREKLANDDDVNMYDLPIKNGFMASKDDAPLYLWFADRFAIDVVMGLREAGYEVRCWIIWNKNVAQFGAIGAQYKSKHEPCIYAFKRGKAPNWDGPNNEVTVWDVARDHVNEYHPTQKPTELAERAMRNHKVELILDMFGGSGSTLIACEKTGRKARLMELSKAYCDVIVKRWENLTGKKAVLDKPTT